MAKTVDQLTAATSVDLADYLLAYKVSGAAPFTRKATLAQLKTGLILVKADVGLSNVDNTSDANKPISSATQTALNAKQATLVSGTNIKSINGTSLLGSGDITVGGSVTPAALTKVDDTNVTLSLGGSPSTALLNAASITVGWSGTLADSRIASASTWNAKQAALVSGTNIKTINGSSILGAGNLTISGGGGGSSVELFISDLEDGVNISGIGTTQLLNTLTNPTTSATYTNASAAAKFPYAAAVYGTIDVATFTYDDVVVMEAFQKASLEDRWTMLKSAPSKTYRYNKGGFLIANEKATPNSTVDSKIFIVDMQGARFVYGGSGAHTCFKKSVTLAQLPTALDRTLVFKNVNIDGDNNSSSIGMQIVGGRSCVFENIEIKDFGTGFEGQSLLQTRFQELRTSACEIGFNARIDLIAGASAAEAVWQPILYNCRFRGITTTCIGAKFRGVEHPRLYDCGWEGSDMLSAVDIDNSGNSVAKKVTIINPRCEINSQGAGTFTGSAFKISGSDYHFVKFEGVEIQNTTPNFTLLDVQCNAGTVMVVMRNCFGNNSNNRWLLKNNDNGGFVAWDFDNVHLQGNPTTPGQVVNTTLHPDIWVGQVTPSRTVKINPRTL